MTEAIEARSRRRIGVATVQLATGARDGAASIVKGVSDVAEFLSLDRARAEVEPS